MAKERREGVSNVFLCSSRLSRSLFFSPGRLTPKNQNGCFFVVKFLERTFPSISTAGDAPFLSLFNFYVL